MNSVGNIIVSGVIPSGFSLVDVGLMTEPP